MKIMCVGQSAYDITLPLDHYPIENKKVRIPFKVECGGGSASNCAYLLAKWGLNTYFAGVIGDDYYGKKIQEEYHEVGVNQRYLQVDSEIETTSSYIIANTSTGSRTILTNRGANVKMSPVTVHDQFDYILFDGYELGFAKEVMEKSPKAIKILDAGSMKEATMELAHIVDYVVCSHDFAEEVSNVKIDYDQIETIQEAYRRLKEEFPGQVIITLEDRGCFAVIDGVGKIIPSIPTKAVDSTGAGDIFHGAFLYFLACGLNLEDVLKLSNITGALSVQKIGSRKSIPNLEEVLSQYHDFI